MPIEGARQRGLLAVLLLHANEVVSTDRLIEDVWRGEPPDTADNALQRQVSRLRHVLEPSDGDPHPLLTRAPGYLLRIAPDALDLERFRRLVDEARRTRGFDPGAAASLLREALALWRGQALADFAFEPFAQVEVARLDEMRVAALEDLIEAELGSGAPPPVAEIEALLAEHPLRERLRGHLMLALYRSGRQADALRVYREGRTTLVEELGIEPGPELRTLEKAILVHDPSLTLNRSPPQRTAGTAARLALGDRVLCPVLVGRSRPLATLVAALARAREGEGRVALLAGDAGAGKTRLARELAEHATNAGVSVIAGACSETELSLPYLPFVEAIGGALAEADRDKLRTALGPAAAELGALFPQLAVGRPTAAPSAVAEQAKLRLFEAMVSLLLTLSADAGLLLILDDMQWAERSTLELTEYLARRLRSSRTLLLLTFRTPEVDRGHPLMVSFERWRRSGGADLIEVTPLDRADVAAMVQAILGPNGSGPDVGDMLHERSDGNPYVVEELLKDALDHGDLIRINADAWESRPAELRLPRGVADMVLRRVDRLSDEHAEALRAAAVLGRTFSFAALVALTERPDEAVRAALDHCVRRQLLDEDDRGDTYHFRHALTWEAIYTDLLPSRRRWLHAHAADALRGVPGQPLVAVAHHLLEGGRGPEAVPVCVDAAAEATRHHAHADAAQLYARAMEYTADGAERGRLLCLWGEAGHRAGDAAAAEERLERGVAMLDQCGDHLEAARHRLSLGRCRWERSQHQRAHSEYELARQALETAGPSEELATAYVRLSSLHTYQFEFVEAEGLAARAADIAERADASSGRIAAALWLGSAQCDQGRLDEGLVHLRRAFDEATSLELHDLAGQALSNTLSVLESYGRVAECGPLLELYRERKQDPWTEMMAAYYAGWLHLWAAELETAAAAIEHLNRLADQYGTRTPLSWGRGVLSVILSELGRFDEARPLVPALDDDLERQELAEQWWEILRFRLATQDVGGALEVAERVLPSAWWAAGTSLPDAAVEALLAAGRNDDATRLVEDVGAQPRGRMNVAHLHRSRGRLALALGDAASATHHLAAATDAFRVGGYRLEVLRTQLLQAQSLAMAGERTEARTAVRRLLADCTACGALTIAAFAARRVEAASPGRPKRR